MIFLLLSQRGLGVSPPSPPPPSPAVPIPLTEEDIYIGHILASEGNSVRLQRSEDRRWTRSLGIAQLVRHYHRVRA